MGAFAEMPEDVSRICGIIAHDLVRTHVLYYNDDTKHTQGLALAYDKGGKGDNCHKAISLGGGGGGIALIISELQ